MTQIAPGLSLDDILLIIGILIGISIILVIIGIVFIIMPKKDHDNLKEFEDTL